MRVLSLFSGIGGLDAGFEKAGFNIVWGNDFDKYAVKTYAANYEHKIGDRRKFCVIDEPRHYENLRLSQE